MAEPMHFERRRLLIDAIGRLGAARDMAGIVMALRGTARAIARADGITVVRREGDKVAYVAEDAASPLWTGQSFPIQSCISGLAMIHNRPILIPDIYADDRVPHAAYADTFVRSMAMFPIGLGEPVMAMGAYWSKQRAIDPEAVTLMSSLARSASEAFEWAARPAPPAPRQSERVS